VILLKELRNGGTGGITPMLPHTGSTINAAILLPWRSKILSTESISLNVATSVSLANPLGIP
jgi:hypothetical protein